MPVLLTDRESVHSYTNANKLPEFVSHVLANRKEFSGQTYSFVDPEPVSLAKLILSIKSILGLKTPRELYVPYPMARFSVGVLARLMHMATRVGVEARLPAEIMFLNKFYESQTLSAEKLKRSSFVDSDPDADIFSELPRLIGYYIPRWVHLNLIDPYGSTIYEPQNIAGEFLNNPESLLNKVLAEQESPFLKQCSLVDGMLRNRRSTDQYN
jgi:hypothetical protein